MFVRRTKIATNEEIHRQQLIEGILLGETPVNLLEKKVAAITKHLSIDCILHAKIHSSLDIIKKMYNSEMELHAMSLVDHINSYLQEVYFKSGDIIPLPIKKAIVVYKAATPPLPPLNYQLEQASYIPANLREFEHLCFENQMICQFDGRIPFATYLYKNFLYYLNASCVEQLDGNQCWQARFAVLLAETEQNDYMAYSAFYSNSVEYRGRSYDCAFVPKYHVRNLRPIKYNVQLVDDREFVEYFESLNVTSVRRIPMQYIGIFLVFPFKEGHYIQPNGEIISPNLLPPKKQYINMNLLAANICNVSQLEGALDWTGRVAQLDHIISCVVHARTLREEGMALMILRRMLGNYLKLGIYNISLPNETEILTWMQLVCSTKLPILPPIHYPQSRGTGMWVGLIQDIAQSCSTNYGASILSSAYAIPELEIVNVFEALKYDAEKYVFYTIIMQRYACPIFFKARNYLKPKFGTSQINLTQYQVCKRNYYNTTLDERLLQAITQPIVRSTDINQNVPWCPPFKCSDLYEFSDVQLKELVKGNNIQLTDEQLAALIALAITQV
uniref:C09D4.1_3 protein n=1 Tax=Fopius arisanus TaxID=64838 RepID=A0A0C9QJ97_9HYME